MTFCREASIMPSAPVLDSPAIKTPGAPFSFPPSPPQTIPSSSDHGSDPGDSDIPLPPPTKIPSAVLDIDQKTPDSHVPRDPRLIRLTGVHPFNVEAPLSALFNEGFLTSPELFYVRNHGPVPQVADADIPNWELTIEG